MASRAKALFRDFCERVRRRVQLGALVSGLDYAQPVRLPRKLGTKLEGRYA
jgi:hypothetical protein